MDGYEATKVVLQRIQSLDPENASKIMGFLLIQDHGEKEMIRLAFGSEALLHSLIIKAKKELGLSPTQNSFSSTSSRLLGGGGVMNRPPPLNIAKNLDFQTQDSLISPTISNLPFYGGGELDLLDEFQLQDQLSFLNNGSFPSVPKNNDIFYPKNNQDLSSSPNGGVFPGSNYSLHRRSCSVSDICLESDEQNSGFGWKPCFYFARGYCKNGTNCRFLHEVSDSSGSMVEQCQELLRSKHQRLVAADFPSPTCMNFLLQQQQLQVQSPRAAAALMMSNTKLSRACFERGDLTNPSSRQIYLTFPADSTFKEEDVSNYFSNFGPVQDVRIPYQQKRMFGFVTFVYSETVKMILAKGNPHFVCDSRVLVKPYKEKGKIPEKFRKQQDQIERGEFNGCGSPTGLEAVDPYDIPLGARMLYNTQDMLWRRKLEEQADLQQAIELQSRRLMNLQFLDAKRSNHNRTHSMGALIPSPIHSPGFLAQKSGFSTDCSSPEAIEENGSAPKAGNENTNFTDKDKRLSEDEEDNGKKSHNEEENRLPESLEHNLPDNPFASPKASGEAEKCSNNNLVASSTLFPVSASADMTPFTSCYFQMSRSPSGQGTIRM